jgi:tRNA 2-selenouridine synthase
MAGRGQPSQKLFESTLLAELERLDPGRPIVVEAESSKIGQLNLPPMLWKAMASAPRIELDVPRAARVAYLLAVYGDIAADTPAVASALAALPGRHGRKQVGVWRDQLDRGQIGDLADSLVELHYDPAYERSRRGEARRSLGVVAMADLNPDQQQDAARRIAALVKGVAE